MFWESGISIKQAAQIFQNKDKILQMQDLVKSCDMLSLNATFPSSLFFFLESSHSATSSKIAISTHVQGTWVRSDMFSEWSLSVFWVFSEIFLECSPQECYQECSLVSLSGVFSAIYSVLWKASIEQAPQAGGCTSGSNAIILAILAMFSPVRAVNIEYLAWMC